MEQTLIVKRAKLQAPNKATLPGAFSVQTSRVKWDPSDPSEAAAAGCQAVVVLLSTISSGCAAQIEGRSLACMHALHACCRSPPCGPPSKHPAAACARAVISQLANPT